MTKINLFKRSEIQMNKKQQQLIFGGNACKCGSCGTTATTYDNSAANYAGNITGTGTANPMCICNGATLAETTRTV